MPERMTRSAPVPSSSVNLSSFLLLGTATHSFTLTARKSDLLNVSKSTCSSNKGSMTTFEKSKAAGRGGIAGSGGVGDRLRSTLPPAGQSLVAHVRREQQHVANGRRVGEQHDQTVDAHAHAACRRHAVLERAHVVLVEAHRLVVAHVLRLNLRAGNARLVDRVVQLAEGVGVLVPADEHSKRSVRLGSPAFFLASATPRADGRSRTWAG